MSTPTISKRNTNKNSTNEADIIFNRANVALARSQRLVASWLPPPAADEKQKGEISEAEQAELQRQEDEMFTPVPERYVYMLLENSGRKKREKGLLTQFFTVQTRPRSPDPQARHRRR
jgi:hypothetical protein